MKKETLTSKRLWLPVIVMTIVIGLASWDFMPSPADFRPDQPISDTPPPAKKKVRDLDEAIAELDAMDLDKEMEKVQEEINRAMKEIDAAKISQEVQKAMREVDFSKMQEEINNAMKEIDMEKIKMEVEQSLAKVDWEKMKAELAGMQKVDFSKMQEELAQSLAQLKDIQPRIEKELANVKVDMKKVKESMEKAKVELKEYKEFVDALDRDGLIDKNSDYSIRHEDGELFINGKKVSREVYSKYSDYLKKHKDFNWEKTRD